MLLCCYVVCYCVLVCVCSCTKRRWFSGKISRCHRDARVRFPDGASLLCRRNQLTFLHRQVAHSRTRALAHSRVRLSTRSWAWPGPVVFYRRTDALLTLASWPRVPPPADVAPMSLAVPTCLLFRAGRSSDMVLESRHLSRPCEVCVGFVGVCMVCDLCVDCVVCCVVLCCVLCVM